MQKHTKGNAYYHCIKPHTRAMPDTHTLLEVGINCGKTTGRNCSKKILEAKIE